MPEPISQAACVQVTTPPKQTALESLTVGTMQYSSNALGDRLFISSMSCVRRTFRPIAPLGFLGGGGSKIRCCCCGGNVEYSGMILMSPTSGPRSSTSRFIRLQASSISWGSREIVFTSWVQGNKRVRVRPTTRCPEAPGGDW